MASLSSYWDSFSDEAEELWGEYKAIPDKVYDYVANKSEETTDEVLASYAKTDVSRTVDKALVQAEKISDVVNKSLGYYADPENVMNMLNTIKWILIVGGIIYVLILVAPAIRAVMP